MYTTRLTVSHYSRRTTSTIQSSCHNESQMKKPLWHTHTHANTHPCTRKHQTKRTAILCSTRSQILSFVMGTEAMGPDKEYLLTERHREFTILNKNILWTPHRCKGPRTQAKTHTHLTRTRTYSYTHIRPTTQSHTNTHDSTLVKGQPIGDSAQSITRWKQFILHSSKLKFQSVRLPLL